MGYVKAFGFLFVLVICAGIFVFVSSLQKQVKTLEAENQKITLELSAEKKHAENLQEEATQIRTEITNIRNADATIKQQLDEAISNLTANQNRLLSLRDSRKAELLLRIVNNDLKCKTEHFGESGICKAGKWIPK